MLPVASVMGRLLEFGLTYERDDNAVSELDLRTICEWDIRNRLLAVSGVASIVCVGGGIKQYQVVVSPSRLKAYDLTLKEVIEAVEAANLNLPGGVLKSSDQEYIVTGRGRVTSLEDLRTSVITMRGGSPITIAQVAEVQFGAAPKRGDASLNGGIPLVLGAATKAFGADTLTTTYEMEAALDEIEQTLPEGVTLHKALFRQATFIEATIENLRAALLQGAGIVTVVLFIFFLSFRPSFVSFLAMPFSLLLAVIVLRALGVGINAMTLGGMSVALGGVVDDAIIDVENIFRRLRENRQRAVPDSNLRVIYRASMEIRASIVYATLITMVVFLPVFFLSGPEGRIFTPLGFVVLHRHLRIPAGRLHTDPGTLLAVADQRSAVGQGKRHQRRAEERLPEGAAACSAAPVVGGRLRRRHVVRNHVADPLAGAGIPAALSRGQFHRRHDGPARHFPRRIHAPRAAGAGTAADLPRGGVGGAAGWHGRGRRGGITGQLQRI